MNHCSKMPYPSRVEGWLNVFDREIELGHRTSSVMKNMKLPNLTWEPYFCVLLQDEQTFTAYRSEDLSIGDALFVDLPRVRLDGGAKAFRQKWGYDISSPLGLLEEVDEEDDQNEDTSISESASLREDIPPNSAYSPIGELKSQSLPRSVFLSGNKYTLII